MAWIVSKTGGSEEVGKARAEQGTLIASGLMAGAAIVGIFTAVLRLDDVGAPIRFLSVGVKFELVEGHLKHTPQEWFEGFTGQFLSLAMFVGLSVACYLLARQGAKWAKQGEGK